MANNTTQRLNNLRDSLKERKLHGILVSAPENRRYLSGFTGSAGYLLITRDDAVLATDFRYIEQADHEAPDFRVVRIGPGNDWFPHLLAETHVTKLGFESEDMTVAFFQRLRQTLKDSTELGPRKVRLVGVTGLMESLRACKDQDEMQLLERAIDIGDQAMNAVGPTIRAGQTEREVAWRLEVAMRDLGADGLAFDIIVASGPNGALPHHRAGDRAIREGEPIVIDMGARYQGYCSDLTRTLIVGTPDDTFRRIYDTVLGAQLTAIATIQVGMTGTEADALARKVIEEAGHGDHFGHGLGHGVGLAVHEHPRVGPSGQDVLKEGMVFSIEPGI
ncbi:MAG: Xaa-Pro peptidase family protein [Dehalococcoidia bacterium]